MSSRKRRSRSERALGQLVRRLSAATEPTLAAQLKASQAALGSVADCVSANDVADWQSRYDLHTRLISGSMNLLSDVARYEAALLAVRVARAAHLTKKRELEEEITAFIDLFMIADARQRDAEYDRQRQIRQALQRLAEGTLLKSPDTPYESLAYLERHTAELTVKRDRAREALARD